MKKYKNGCENMSQKIQTEFRPYQINSEALLADVLAKHPFGVFGAVKEHIDNAIDANSSEIDISFDEKTRQITIANIAPKCYMESDVEQLFHRRHHGKISQNDYGRMILFGFTEPKVITIETYINDSKKTLRTYQLTPKGWKLSNETQCKTPPEFTTKVMAILKKDIDFEVNDFANFINSIYNLHLYRKAVKISVNRKQLEAILPHGEPKTKEFEFGGHKFMSYLWQPKPQWERKIYQSMTTKGVTDGVFITSKNTLVTYAPFHRSHAGEELSYFCLINDEEGYFAEDALDLGKLQLMFIPKVSRFYRYIKDNILPKEKTKPSDVITEGNQYIKDFFSVGIGSYEPKEKPKTEVTEGEEKPEGEGKAEEAKSKEKQPNINPEHRTSGLPELQLRTMKDFTMVPFIDIVNPKLLALNDADPLFEKSWMKDEMREVFLIRMVPFLDARRVYTPEQVHEARKEWQIQDMFMRKLLRAKPKKKTITKQGRGRPRKLTETAITAPTETFDEKEYDKLYEKLTELDEQLIGNKITPEQYDNEARDIRGKIFALKKLREEKAQSVEKPEKPKRLEAVEEPDKARAEIDERISKMKPIKTWNLPTRMDKSTGKQTVITMGLFKVDGKNVRRPVSKQILSGDQITKNFTKPSREEAMEKKHGKKAHRGKVPTKKAVSISA